MGKVLILASAIWLVGCQTVPSGSFCQIAKPIRPSSATIDALSDAEVKALLSHNLKGAKLCGWRK